jgi:multisubunit Na+/H+ antiporter MnhG subunit
MGRSQTPLEILEAGGVGNKFTGLGTGDTTGVVILTLAWALAVAATITKKLSKAMIFFMMVFFAMTNAIFSSKIARTTSENKGSDAATPTKRPNDKQHRTSMGFSPYTTVSPDKGHLYIPAVVRRKISSLVRIIRRWRRITSRASQTSQSSFF